MSLDNVPEIPFLYNVGLFTTYKCEVSCPHCLVEAGPQRKEEILLKDAFCWIKQIAAYRNNYIRGISLTGGEPFYNLANLIKISDFGDECGLIVSAITNGFWAVNQEQAVKILRKLHSIKMLAISADVHHQKYIPIERISNVIHAAKECNILYRVYICTEDENSEEHRELLEKVQKIAEPDKIDIFSIFLAGRAQKTISTSDYQISDDPPISACWFSSSPVIFPDGKVVACIGPLINIKSPHPLILGNLREHSLKEIFDTAEANPILHVIRIWGPKKLIEKIKEAGFSANLPQKYSKYSCNVCYELMSNTRLSDFYSQLAQDAIFKTKVAYGRAYFLQETKMLEICKTGSSI